jgi:ribosomal protein S18 acetylase RimI-like enzyme
MDLVGDTALAQRVELAEARLNALAARSLLGEHASVQIGTGFAVFGGPSSPLTKASGLGFWGSSPTPSQLESGEIEEVEAFYQACGVAPVIALSPLAHPALVPALGRRGYTLESFENVLVRPATPLTPQVISGVEIDESPPLTTWADVVARGFAAEPSAHLVELGEALASVPGVVRLLALVDGEPAGGAAVAIDNGVALLFAASVLPAYRQRGIQSALVRARIALSTSRPVAEGQPTVDVLTLCAAAGSSSQRNAERQGFRVAYTRFDLTKLSLPSPTTQYFSRTATQVSSLSRCEMSRPH